MFVVELIYTADLAEIERLMQDDAFAQLRVVEFRASQRADDIPQRVEGS